MKKLSTRFWVILVGIILLLSAAATAYIYLRPAAPAPGDTAVIYLDGVQVERVDLSQVTENYTKEYTGQAGLTNTVEFAPGMVRVQEATCPDQICVYQGWVEAGGLPIACLPNTLIIQVVSAEDVPLLDKQF